MRAKICRRELDAPRNFQGAHAPRVLISGANRIYGTQILISESTANAIGSPSCVFLQRVQTLRRNPPGKDWTGVWQLVEK